MAGVLAHYVPLLVFACLFFFSLHLLLLWTGRCHGVDMAISCDVSRRRSLTPSIPMYGGREKYVEEKSIDRFRRRFALHCCLSSSSTNTCFHPIHKVTYTDTQNFVLFHMSLQEQENYEKIDLLEGKNHRLIEEAGPFHCRSNRRIYRKTKFVTTEKFNLLSGNRTDEDYVHYSIRTID